MSKPSFKKTVAFLCFSALCGCAGSTPKASEYNLGVQAYRTKDYASARQHWAKAITEEHETSAKNNLGYLLYYGLGGKADISQAISLWMQAAERGDRESQWHLGHAAEDGKGVEQSVVKAYAWYRCAATANQASAAADELQAQIARDASQSLARLLPKLSPAEFQAAEKLAKLYIASYSRATPNQ
jgi:TPR repeat protein